MLVKLVVPLPFYFPIKVVMNIIHVFQFSSWLPNMRNSFKRIRVQQVFKQGEKEHVEVLEEFRPKPELDSK